MPHSLWMQSKSGFNCWNRDSLAIRFADHGEAALIIPHRPANALLFKGGAGVVQPGGAHRWVREGLIDPELAAVDRHMVQRGPLAREAHFRTDARGIPSVQPISSVDSVLVDKLLLLREDRPDIFRR